MLSSWRMYEVHLALFLKAGCDTWPDTLMTQTCGPTLSGLSSSPNRTPRKMHVPTSVIAPSLDFSRISEYKIGALFPLYPPSNSRASATSTKRGRAVEGFVARDLAQLAARDLIGGLGGFA
jgi:hypothetical protein